MSIEQKKHILIVEDLIEWQELLSELLQNEYTVTLAGTYDDANSKLQSDIFYFDLVILDVRLDDSDKRDIRGTRLLNMIKNTSPDLPVIILSGYIESIKNEEILNKADYWYKKGSPNILFDIDDFLNNIKKLINNRFDSKENG